MTQARHGTPLGRGAPVSGLCCFTPLLAVPGVAAAARWLDTALLAAFGAGVGLIRYALRGRRA